MPVPAASTACSAADHGAWRAILALALVLLTPAGCALPPRVGADASEREPPGIERSLTLTMAFRHELNSMSPKMQQGGSSGQIHQIFNAGLAVFDAGRDPRPQLAETLPRLNTDSWRVLSDGMMETTYGLRRGLTWHNGQALTANDFVFAWRVYTDPNLGFIPRPQDRIEDVVALDTHTLRLRWRGLYPGAGELALDLVPLPESVLHESFAAYQQSGDAQAFLNQAYWTIAFLGAGPYRLVAWERGSQLEAVAFPGYALGAPRIDRLILRISSNENAVLAGILADQIEFAMENTLRFEHALTLQQTWVPEGRGLVSIRPSSVIAAAIQFRPEYQREPGLLDTRVRQAMAWSIDRQALQDGLYAGEGEEAPTLMSAENRFYPDVARAVSRYTYDPRRAEQLMTAAGYTRYSDGFFASESGDRFQPQFQVLAGTTFERAQAIITDAWWRSGLQVQPAVLASAQVLDNQARSTFRGLGMVLVGASADDTFTSTNISSAASRWRGANRGGWANAEFDQLFLRVSTALDRLERSELMVRMMNLLNEELPALPLYFDLKVLAHVSRLSGPEPQAPLWNIHAWQLHEPSGQRRGPRA